MLMKFSIQLTVYTVFLLGAVTFAQKTNVTDAALLMKKYNPMSGVEPSKKILLKAKDFIDLAAVNSETATSPKMHMYRGEIYFGLIELAAMEAATSNINVDETLLKEYESKAKESFNKVLEDPKKEYINDINIFLGTRTEMYFNMGIQSFSNRNFEMATNLFLGAMQVKSFLNETYPDAEVNAQLCLSRAVDSLLSIKNFDKAIEISNLVNEAMPKNVDVLISMINIYLQKGDIVGSEKYLKEALALAPNNKQLYYVLGTANMDLNENEKADAALTKALEIDSNYSDAQYQLGAHLFNWAGQLKKEAGQLAENDTNYDVLITKATAMQYRSLALLEKYILTKPNEKAVLEILRSTYSKLGNAEKAGEYKKRLEALK